MAVWTQALNVSGVYLHVQVLTPIPVNVTLVESKVLAVKKISGRHQFWIQADSTSHECVFIREEEDLRHRHQEEGHAEIEAEISRVPQAEEHQRLPGASRT